jgi:hypothetical protein
MKYLFFFNGQPLLLCCVCCKIAIQDFLKGLHKKNKKNLRFHRRVYRRTITRRYFTESCKNIYGIVPHSPMAFRRLFRRPIPTDLCTSRSARMSDTCPSARIPTALPTSNIDGITDGLSHIPKRTHVWHVSVCTNTDGFADVKYRRNHRWRTHVWHVSVCTNTDGFSNGFADGSKSLAGFSNFFDAYFN